MTFRNFDWAKVSQCANTGIASNRVSSARQLFRGEYMVCAIGRGHVAQKIRRDRGIFHDLTVEDEHVVSQFDRITRQADDSLDQPFFVVRGIKDYDVTALRIAPFGN